jgi:endonuclease/exonuclease/phosphatase family metal-dependent hydrolase
MSNPTSAVCNRQTSPVRIGTWNLQGRWDARHLELIENMQCDALLLTEVSERVQIPGMSLHLSSASMAPCRRWAGVASSHALVGLRDPHGASAAAVVDGRHLCSSILPWRSCGVRRPWAGHTTAEKTAAAVADIEASSPLIWGGDWNHALSGREWSGSRAGRHHILTAAQRLDLQVPTASAPHRIPGLLTIDHIAVPQSWQIHSVERYPADAGGRQISDHDAYAIGVSEN